MDSEAYLKLLQKVTSRIRKCDSVTNETCYHTTWTT